MKVRSIPIIIAVLLHAMPAVAASVTLEECVQRALSGNSRLKADEMLSNAAGEDVAIARSRMLPSLRASGAYTLVDKPDRLIFEKDTFTPGNPPDDVTVIIGEDSSYSLNLILEQPLFTGGKLLHSLRGAQKTHDAASLATARKKREVALDVTRAFRETLIEGLNVDTSKKLIDAKTERLRVLRERQAEGYVLAEEVVQQESDIAFAELDLLKCENRKAIAMTRLKNAINADRTEELELLGTPRNSEMTLALAEALDAALTGREDLQAARARENAFDEDRRVAQGDYLPQLSLQGRYIRQKETNLFRPENWVLSAQMEWALFEWGKTRSEVAKKAALTQKARHESDELRKDILLQAERLWRTVHEQEQTVAAYEKKLRTVEYLLAQDLERYAEGKVTLSEVVSLEANLARANTEYLAAINKLDMDMAELETALSRSLSGSVTEKAVYRPDFTRLTATLKRGFSNRQAVDVAPEAGAHKSTSAAEQTAVDLLESLSKIR